MDLSCQSSWSLGLNLWNLDVTSKGVRVGAFSHAAEGACNGSVNGTTLSIIACSSEEGGERPLLHTALRFEVKLDPTSGATQRHRLTRIDIHHTCRNARLSTTPWALNIYDFGQRYQSVKTGQWHGKEAEGGESDSGCGLSGGDLVPVSCLLASLTPARKSDLHGQVE